MAATAPTYSELFPELPNAAPKGASARARGVSVSSKTVTQVFQLPVEEQRVTRPSFGMDTRQAKAIKRIMEETGTKIDTSTARDDTLCIVIKGQKEAVFRAKIELFKVLQKAAEVRPSHRMRCGRPPCP